MKEKEQEEGASQAPDIFYLDKIYSLRKQLLVFDTLQHFNPTHYERLWMVGFLKYVGYSSEEVLDIIDQHCEWADYSPRITQYQVSTIYKHQHCNFSTGNNGMRSTIGARPRKWDLSPLELYRCRYARSAEGHRRLTAWARTHHIPVFEHEGEFDPSKLGKAK